tara:strand:+ start:18909 stop:21608 length:2700 start_codon:yes stop_codon:yes gene_type:complete
MKLFDDDQKKKKLLDDYFEKQYNAEQKYGKDSVVIYQKGNFYEIYSYPENEKVIGKAPEISLILNFMLTKSNKNNPKLDKYNPNMVGILMYTIDKHINLLINKGYTLIIVSQSENNENRFIENVYSPGTYVDSVSDTNHFICCIFTSYASDYIFGISLIDLSIGECLYTLLGTNPSLDPKEDLYRILSTYKPKEVIIVYDTIFEKVEAVQKIIECPLVHIYSIQEYKEFQNPVYQNEILSDIYEIRNNMTLIEFFNLEYKPEVSISITFLINFCIEHNRNYTQELKYPEEIQDIGLIVHNNALEQLNIINSERSLFSILNHTSTSMGKRLLEKLLCHPITDIQKLSKIYNDIEDMKSSYTSYESILNNIVDIEKLHRTMINGKLHHQYISSLNQSYINILELYKLYPKQSHESKFKSYLKEFTKGLDIENVENLLQKGFSKEIDQLQTDLDFNTAKFYEEVVKLNNIIKTKQNETVKVEKFVIFTTKNRSEKIKQFDKSYQLEHEKSKVKITSDIINTIVHKITQIETKLKPLIEEKYKKFIQDLYKKYCETLNLVSKFVSEIDVTKSRTKCAVLYNYCKPVFRNNNDTGSIYAKELRHPIVERLDNKVSYVPNDVSFDENNMGMILYGVNGVGKSCFSKSVGISVIMAQSGHYVSATSFEYSPFTKLFTRINGNDNLYKGQSSFIVEMNELRPILKGDSKTLIIGDEPCRGTEDISAMSIVSTFIKRLIKNECKFVFATHLSKLTSCSNIKEEPKLMTKHLSVTIDKKNDIFTFERKMLNGLGETSYGIEVAKYVIHDQSFIDEANIIRKELQNIKKNVSSKISKYNNKLSVNNCEVCKSDLQLETHHIIYRCKKGTNELNNLCVLCHKCHEAVHHGNLVIEGWIQTTEKIYLNFYYT